MISTDPTLTAPKDAGVGFKAEARQAPPPHILVLDDQLAIRSLLHEVLTANHYRVSLAKTLSDAQSLIDRESFDAVIVDIYLSETESGLSLLPYLGGVQPHTPAVVISGMARMDDVMEALKAGAYDMLCKPFNIIDVLHVISRAVEKKRMAVENERLVAALRQERDLLEIRVREATADLEQNVEMLRLLNEQIATMFEMSQTTVGDGSSEGTIRRIFELLRRMIDFEGAFCVIYDIRAQDINLALADRPVVQEYCNKMSAMFRAQGYALVDLAESQNRMPVENLQSAIRQLAPEGLTKETDLMLMPLHVHQSMLGVVGLIRKGRTLLTRAEERILGLAISHFLAVLEQRNFITRTAQLAGLGELISEIAHDLRHPMTSLRGASRILLDGWQDDAKRARCLEEIAGNVARMESLVSELVNFYNPKDMNMVPVDLHALLDQALSITRSLLEQKHIEVTRRYEPATIVILGLSRNLIEAFVNLISNACQACAPVGGRITIAAAAELNDDDNRRLREFSRHPSSYVRIEIADNGCGIPNENKEKVFRRFFTTRPEGHGLGLSAVTRILKKNLGHIHLESEVGRGTTFYMYLPKA
ncbi:MAG: ATP-binding protein [bacterium]|nr:ATP-binding protein [bacterium]